MELGPKGIAAEIDPEKLRRPEAEVFAKRTDAAMAVQLREFDIRRPMPPFRIPDRPTWVEDPYNDKTWLLYYHSFYWVEAVHHAVEIGQDASGTLQDWLADLARQYVTFFHGLIGNEDDYPKSLVDAVWDDHATSYRLSHFSYMFLKVLKSRFNPADLVAIERFARCHIGKLREYLDSDRWLLSNHTLFQIEGLLDGAVTFLTDAEERTETIRFALDHYMAWIDRIIIVEEGTVREHAAFYHAFLIGRVRDFDGYARALLGDDAVPDMSDTLRRMADFYWTMSVDKNVIPAFGDTKYKMKVAPKYIEFSGQAPFDNDHSEFIRTNGRKGKQKVGLFSYPTAGHYIVRAGPVGSQLFSSFLDKPFIGPHGHSDAMSFETFWNGEPVLADSGGPFKYGNQLRFKYFQKPVAHNAVIVGNGQQVYHSTMQTARGSNGVTVLKADARVTKQCRWIRAFVQMRNEYVLVADMLDGTIAGGAYARFQMGLNYHPTETGDTAYELVNQETGHVVHARFFRDGFGHVAHPDEVTAEKIEMEYDGRTISLHEHAFLTAEDNQFDIGALIRQPMAPQSLMVSLFAFQSDPEVLHVSQDGAHQFNLNSSTGDFGYVLTLKDRVVDGRVCGFSVNSELRN